MWYHKLQPGTFVCNSRLVWFQRCVQIHMYKFICTGQLSCRFSRLKVPSWNLPQATQPTTYRTYLFPRSFESFHLNTSSLCHHQFYWKVSCNNHSNNDTFLVFNTHFDSLTQHLHFYVIGRTRDKDSFIFNFVFSFNLWFLFGHWIPQIPKDSDLHTSPSFLLTLKSS